MLEARAITKLTNKTAQSKSHAKQHMRNCRRQAGQGELFAWNLSSWTPSGQLCYKPRWQESTLLPAQWPALPRWNGAFWCLSHLSVKCIQQVRVKTSTHTLAIVIAYELEISLTLSTKPSCSRLHSSTATTSMPWMVGWRSNAPHGELKTGKLSQTVSTWHLKVGHNHCQIVCQFWKILVWICLDRFR